MFFVLFDVRYSEFFLWVFLEEGEQERIRNENKNERHMSRSKGRIRRAVNKGRNRAGYRKERTREEKSKWLQNSLNKREQYLGKAVPGRSAILKRVLFGSKNIFFIVTIFFYVLSTLFKLENHFITSY